MKNCKHIKYCNKKAMSENGKDVCILHLDDPQKDMGYFKKALKEHMQNGNSNFSYFVFPSDLEFDGMSFDKDARFYHSKFYGNLSFYNVKFLQNVTFTGTIFHEAVSFVKAEFKKNADFIAANFKKVTEFGGAVFHRSPSFHNATMKSHVSFNNAYFLNGAQFTQVDFSNSSPWFMDTHFLGKTIFEKCLGENGQILPIFHGIKDGRFTDLFIGPDARIIFRSADLSLILFFGTRLINIEFTDIVWAQTKDILCFDRIALFDELDLRKAIEETKTSKEKIDLAKNFSHVEILYRDIKRAYEEDKNHEFAGEFHYGEKEMKRKNPSTNIVLRFFLFLYWAISGYGERFLRPLFWLALIFIVSTVGHMFLGLSASTTETLHPTNVQD